MKAVLIFPTPNFSTHSTLSHSELETIIHAFVHTRQFLQFPLRLFQQTLFDSPISLEYHTDFCFEQPDSVTSLHFAMAPEQNVYSSLQSRQWLGSSILSRPCHFIVLLEHGGRLPAFLFTVPHTR